MEIIADKLKRKNKEESRARRDESESGEEKSGEESNEEVSDEEEDVESDGDATVGQNIKKSKIHEESQQDITKKKHARMKKRQAEAAKMTTHERDEKSKIHQKKEEEFKAKKWTKRADADVEDKENKPYFPNNIDKGTTRAHRTHHQRESFFSDDKHEKDFSPNSH